MALKYNRKIDLNLTGTSFTDETHDSVGASVFNLDHDWFINDTASGDVLIIRTAAAGGGTLLVENTHYTISNQDNLLSGEDYVDKAVYSDITITDAAYQATTLYFSGKYVSDSTEALDIGQVTWQYAAKTADETLDPDGYYTYGCAGGSDGIKLTLPAVSTNITGQRLEFIKTDDTDTAVMIDGSGAETINGLTHIMLIEQYQKVELFCTGTAWIIIKGTLIADSGWINTNDWTTRHLGTVDVDYDNLSGTFQIGEIITEATSSNTGIIVADDGSTLTLWRVTGDGIFTDNRVITGSISAATADVDEPGTTTKIQDSNFYHGWGITSSNIEINTYMCLANTYTEANLVKIDNGYCNDGTATGINILGVDTNNFQIQTGSSGFFYVNSAGARTQISANDYMYKIVAKLTI